MAEFVGWKKFTWKSWVFLIVLVGLFVFLQKRNEKNSFNQKLVNAANEINKNCPIQVDSSMRLDNAIALVGNKLQYNYTLSNQNKEAIDTTALKNRIEIPIINFIKTDPKSKLFRDNKTTLLYNFRNEDGSYLFSIVVSPEKYDKQ